MAEVKPVKLVLVTAEYDPLRSKALKVAKKAAEELGIEFEEKLEDWGFLKAHGEADPVGGYDLPQFFIVYSDGSVKHVLTRIPITPDGRIDVNGAVDRILSAASTS